LALHALLRVLWLAGRGRRNALAVRVVHHRARLPALPASLAGLRLLQISDLHLDMDPDLVHRMAETVAPLRPDACLLTGDYRYRTHGPSDAALAALAALRPALGEEVLAVLGNHDSIRMVPEMERLGIRVLLNESVAIGAGRDRLHVAGVDDPHYFRTHDVAEALQAVPEGSATVLLAHSPEIYREAAAHDIGLVLCGHTHGGQIRLPGRVPLYINADCPRRMAAGHWRWRNLQGYTSVGAGASVLPVRFNCPPEVVLHTLYPA
jgi:predicted MPP superfamily phosphohydrolase